MGFLGVLSVVGDPRKDPRWQRLHDRDWTCPSCGRKHVGLFDRSLDAPIYWQGSQEPLPNSEVRSANNVLTDDFCILDGEHFFVRCVLTLPIVGAGEQRFGFGIWSSLSKANFDLYVDTFKSHKRDHLGPWYGWFSNRLSAYPDTLNLKCRVSPQDSGQRPLIELEPTEHPLAIEQRHGITFDRILELYALSGHDLGGSLTD